MAINTDVIMQGRGEVSLREAYSALRKNGIDARALDSTYKKLSNIQEIALMILGISFLVTVIVSSFVLTPMMRYIGAKMVAATLGFAAAAGLVALAAFCAKHYHLSSVKLNTEQANQLLKNIKRAVEKERADYLRSAHYQDALRTDTYIKQMAERIQPDQQIQ